MKVMVGEIQGEEKEVKSFYCYELKTSFWVGALDKLNIDRCLRR